MLTHFRDRHSTGSIITDLLRVEEGLYVVKAQIIVNTIVLGCGIAGSTTVEEAEDAAIQRALRTAGFDTARGDALLSYSNGISATSMPSHQPLPPPAPLGPTNLSSASAGDRYGENQFQAEPVLSTWTGNPASVPSPPVATPSMAELAIEDLSELIAQTDVELTRIGWGPKEGRKYLKDSFGKQSRQQLDERELREFLRHLKNQPTRMLASEPAEAF
jgi:hypothetical protein